MTTPEPAPDPTDASGPVRHDPTALRLRDGLRVEVLEDEALALDPREGVVHRLEGAAARIVAALRDGRTPALADDRDNLVVTALIEARIVES
jgi:hypothetical protein